MTTIPPKPSASHPSSIPDRPDAPVYRLAFGKYKGQPIREVPEGALRHYLGWDALYSDARQQNYGFVLEPGGAEVIAGEDREVLF
jgi:hypothetical protein